MKNKKLISLIIGVVLTFSVIISIAIIPSSAEESSFTLSGNYIFKSQLETDPVDNSGFSFDFVCNDVTYNYMGWSDNNGQWIFGYAVYGTATILPAYILGEGWIDYSYREINISSQTVSSDVYEYIKNYCYSAGQLVLKGVYSWNGFNFYYPFDYSFRFHSGGADYFGMSLYEEDDHIYVGYRTVYSLDSDFDVVAEVFDGYVRWLDRSYMTIEFPGNFQLTPDEYDFINLAFSPGDLVFDYTLDGFYYFRDVLASESPSLSHYFVDFVYNGVNYNMIGWDDVNGQLVLCYANILNSEVLPVYIYGEGWLNDSFKQIEIINSSVDSATKEFFDIYSVPSSNLSLSGTYFFNAPFISIFIDERFPFKVGDEQFGGISVYKFNGNSFLGFYNSDCSVLINVADLFSDSIHWYDDSYKNLTFDDSFTYSPETVDFINSYFRSSSDCICLNGSFEFSEVLNLPASFMLTNTSFSYDGTYYDYFNYERGILTFGSNGEFTNVYDLGLWYIKSPIIFNNVFVPYEFYEGLLYLATPIEESDPEPDPEPEPDTLYYKIISEPSTSFNSSAFSDSLSFVTSSDYDGFGSLVFECNGQEFYGIVPTPTVLPVNYSFVVVYRQSEGWTSQAFRYISYDSTADDPYLKEWLNTNTLPLSSDPDNDPDATPDPDPVPDPDPGQSGDYNSGYYDGYDVGYSKGYDAGYGTGYYYGYSDGKNSVDSDDFAGGLLTNIFTGPINALDNIVLYETSIDGNVVTISLWSIFCTILMSFIVVWILKLFFGH